MSCILTYALRHIKKIMPPGSMTGRLRSRLFRRLQRSLLSQFVKTTPVMIILSGSLCRHSEYLHGVTTKTSLRPLFIALTVEAHMRYTETGHNGECYPSTEAWSRRQKHVSCPNNELHPISGMGRCHTDGATMADVVKSVLRQHPLTV